MNLKKKIFYWSPFLVPIATPKAVINSAHSLQRYSSDYKCTIINFFGEFNIFKRDILDKNITLKNSSFHKINKFLPFKGKIKSRFSYLVIFLLSFVPLKNILTKEKPDYLIVQLITSLPMILILLFNFKTKFILRISGLPRVTFFRKILWKMALKKFHLVTCPTQTTMEYIKSLNIINEERVHVLFDPIIEVKKMKLKINEKNYSEHKNYFLAAGRLTKQKNFIFLCEAFHKIILKYPDSKLLIAGDGEDKDRITNYIVKNKLEKNIILLGHVANIYPLMKFAKSFIMSSLWEDPGFVIIEAAFCRTMVFSSDCNTGPKEIIKDNFNGILFKSNNIDNFLEKFELLISSFNKKDLLINNLKQVRQFTQFNHYISFEKLLSL